MDERKLFVSDYCLLGEGDDPEDHRLSQFERLTLTGGKELDRSLQWIATQITKLTAQQELGELNVRRARAAYSFYTQEKWKADPASFFVPPRYTPRAKEFSVHGLKDGEILDIEFPSCYEVQNPSFRRESKRYEENRTVHARMWRHRDGAKGTIIAIHGWSMGDQRINALAFLPGYFYGLGLDVVLVELPYHGRRSPKKIDGRRVLFPGAHMSRTNEGMAQIISDLRELRLYLESTGSKNIGCMGISLGGYTAALWASLDELSFSVPIVPMVCMGEVAWEMVSRNPVIKKLNKSGFTVETLEEIYRVHSPLTYTPKLPIHRRLLIAGLGDQIVSPRHPHRLWEHWSQPKIHWFAGGHGAQFRKSKAFREVANFFHSLGLTTKRPRGGPSHQG